MKMQTLFFAAAFYLSFVYCQVENPKSSAYLLSKKQLLELARPLAFEYKCMNKHYNEIEIKKAMKKSCIALGATKKKRICKSGICETAITAQRDAEFKNLPPMGYNGQVVLYPILRSSKVYRFENIRDAGHDRIVTTKDCRLLSIVTSVKEPRRSKVIKCNRVEIPNQMFKILPQVNAMKPKTQQTKISVGNMGNMKIQNPKGKGILVDISNEASTSGTKTH